MTIPAGSPIRLIDESAASFDAIRRAFAWNIPLRYNIGVDICDRPAARHGDRTALICEDAQGVERRLSFAQLKERSDRLANALEGIGAKRGDRVGICLPQRIETAISHIAIAKIGGIAMPLSILFGPEALSFRLSDSGARLLITDLARKERIESLIDRLPEPLDLVICDHETKRATGAKGTSDAGSGGVYGFDDLLQGARDRFQAADTLACDPALLIYTSGTTGPPKGSLNPHRCLLGNLPGFELSHDFFPQQDDLMWTPADWAWTGGLLDALMPALRYGVPTLGCDHGPFDPERTLETIEKYRVRNAFIPPTALKLMMHLPHRAFEAISMRTIMSAGEQVGVPVAQWAKATLDVDINEMWGQTECNYLIGNSCAILPPKAGSMGKPYPGHRVRTIDDEGRQSAVGAIGELAVHRDDPVMFLGYWKNAAASEEKFTGEWFRTGDLGVCDEEGFFRFMGRKDDVISSAGYRIGPGEIEDCLLKHPAVRQSAVVGVPDTLRGERVKAFIVLESGFEKSDDLAEEIRLDVRNRLAAHEYPREIEFIDSLPMTTTGKIRRIALRRRDAPSVDDPSIAAAPIEPRKSDDSKGSSKGHSKE
ncbi:MAG: AMP-binding protein [Ectothiorhodospiraceae bacterium AqS1]|nr:AMP-binding protein [Ectothiorhodospiraceae bacterium AqS1]